MNTGIINQKAPELKIERWIGIDGNLTSPIELSDLSTRFKIIYCFQSWCPGCHSHGFPSLKKMVDALKDNKNISFLAIQTVFEGYSSNPFEKIKELQEKYSLKIPFAHDDSHIDINGDKVKSSSLMIDYKNGGTPWFIVIDGDKVIFNNFQIDYLKIIEEIKKQTN